MREFLDDVANQNQSVFSFGKWLLIIANGLIFVQLILQIFFEISIISISLSIHSLDGKLGLLVQFIELAIIFLGIGLLGQFSKIDWKILDLKYQVLLSLPVLNFLLIFLGDAFVEMLMI